MKKFYLTIIAIIIFGILGTGLIRQYGVISDRGLLAPSIKKLENLQKDPITFLIPEGGKQFCKRDNPGTGFPEPSGPSVWRHSVSPFPLEETRKFYHSAILQDGWEYTGRNPSGTNPTCDLPIEDRGCGAVYYHGDKELWLQLGSTEYTQNVCDIGDVPAGYQTIVTLSLFYR